MSIVEGYFILTLAVLSVLFALACMALRRVSTSRLCVKMFDNEALKEVKCPMCTAGIQLLDARRSVWGPIPMHVRIVRQGSRHFNPRQANVRNCNYCQGLGRVIVRCDDHIIPNELRPTDWP